MEAQHPTIQVLICQAYSDFLLSAIQKAKRSIDILMFDWRWYPLDPSAAVQLINQALVAAKKRGVLVRMVCDSDQSLKYFREVGLDAKCYSSKALLHAKVLVIDGNLSLVGSHNMTMNAMTQNCEVSFAVLDTPTAILLTNYFEAIWQKS